MTGDTGHVPPTTAAPPGHERSWSPGRPVHLGRTLGALRRGPGDPAHQVDATGALWRTTRTPSGAATLRVTVSRRDGVVRATAWGAGAEEVLDGLPALLGEGDDCAGFVPRHPVLRELWAAYGPGWRVPRTGRVLEALVPAILEQKVTGAEAFRAWRLLLRAYGEPAPGPAPAGMRVPPTAEQWARVPSWGWHRAGVDAKRSRTVVLAARVATRLEESTDLPVADAVTRLRAVPGVGAWTAAEVRQRAHGDADAVSLGDLHLPKLVGWSLAGRPVDDDGMLELLAPYAGHRYRATRLLELSGRGYPRFAPRYAPRDFRRM